MPIFEFQCNKCGYIFEEVYLKTDPTKISSHCPACQKNGIKSIGKKIMSQSSFRINGYNAENGYSK